MKAEQQKRKEEAERQRQEEAERQETLELSRIAAETEWMRLSSQSKPDSLTVPDAVARPKLPA